MHPKPIPPEDTQEISLRLESYDDIFSDFDMRSYDKRSLSVDFIDEIRRASFDKSDEGVDLSLYVPAGARSDANESTIKERLASHFERHYGMVLKDKRKTMTQGVLMIVLGVISMLLATFILFGDTEGDILKSFLIVFLEPAAWFLLWEGADVILFTSREINPELSFYKKMFISRENLHFKAY